MTRLATGFFMASFTRANFIVSKLQGPASGSELAGFALQGLGNVISGNHVVQFHRDLPVQITDLLVLELSLPMERNFTAIIKLQTMQ
jgi:hypothetical protein